MRGNAGMDSLQYMVVDEESEVVALFVKEQDAKEFVDNNNSYYDYRVLDRDQNEFYIDVDVETYVSFDIRG